MMNQVTIFKKVVGIKGKSSKKKQHEEKIQLSVCKYLKLQYPDAIFTCDLSSGMKMPIWMAAKAKAQKSSRGLPDLMVFEPRKGYNGLCIELKKDRASVYLKDGKTLVSDKSGHIKEQDEILTRLTNKGYFAIFGMGFDHCKKVIDWYFNLEK